MYNYEYSFKEIKKNRKQKIETHLNVKYRFDKEITSTNKKDIKKRMNSSLIEYLRKKENLILTKNHYDHILYFEDHNNLMRHLKIEKPFLKRGIDVFVTSHLKTPLEEMLNLDALNDFILTGKI